MNKKYVFFPEENRNQYNTYHTFVIQVNDRDNLRKYLKSKNIETAIHYPIPIHLQPAARCLGYKRNNFIVAERQAKNIDFTNQSIFKRKREIKYISENINSFYKKK